MQLVTHTAKFVQLKMCDPDNARYGFSRSTSWQMSSNKSILSVDKSDLENPTIKNLQRKTLENICRHTTAINKSRLENTDIVYSIRMDTASQGPVYT